MRARRLALALVLVVATSACAGRAWRAARSEDTAGAYHRFLREHPDSELAPQAKAHLAFVRVRSKPSLQGFERFEEDFPGSPLVEELRPHVEEVFFRRARTRGSARAYRGFLEEFPDGQHAARARGNLEYLEASGFEGDLARLADFAARHPQSDFAPEAERSVAGAALREQTAFRSVALVVDVPDSIPGADRLRRLFAERVRQIYRRAGMALVPADGEAGATLTIAHREKQLRSSLEGGTMTQPSVLAETQVSLTVPSRETPVFRDTLAFRIPVTELGAGESALFHPRAWAVYWSNDFFAPVASWDTRAAARQPKTFAEAPVAVEPMGTRAAVLFGNGDLQIADLSDPASPQILGEYRRPRDLSTFEGVVSLPQGLGIFGVDGIEIVGFEGGSLQRSRSYPRDQVGSIVGLVALGEGLVAAGNRGLLWLGDDGSVRNLVPREILGLDRRGDRLLFTDGTSLFVSSLPVLQGGRVEGELRLGRGFRPGVVRANGAAAVVIGEPGLVQVDVSAPSKPRVVSRMDRSEVGEIRDATVVSGRIFVVGPRGLQVSDPTGERVLDSVDVEARDRLGASGRHLVLIGDGRLQVVDATPFAATRPASPAR